MIRVTVNGSEEVLKIMELIPSRMKLAFLKGMRDTAIIIQSLAKRNAPVWRGLLRASIVQSVSVEGDRIVGTVGSALPYAKVMEFTVTAVAIARRSLILTRAGKVVNAVVEPETVKVVPPPLAW